MTDRKIKICITAPYHWSAQFGGAEQQAQHLLQVLVASERFDVTFLAREFGENYIPNDYTIRKVRSNHALCRYGEFFDAPGVYAALKDIRPDVIYQNIGGAYVGVVAYYAKHNCAKVIWHVASDMDVEPFQGRFSYRFLFNYVAAKFQQYGITNSHKIIAQTDKQAKLLKLHYKRDPDAIIKNFHPLPGEAICKGKDIQVVWIANLKPLKQPEIFMTLAHELQDIAGVTFIMIGSPGKSRWDRSLLPRLVNTKNFQYLGARTHDEVNEILSKSHILVNTSQFEGFPNTFIQAWMRRVPVVSLFANPDGVLDTENIGRVSGNYQRLKSDIQELIENESLLNEMGLRAERFSFETYSERNALDVVRIIEEEANVIDD